MSGDCVYYDHAAQSCNVHPSHLGCCGYEENCYRAYKPRPKKKKVTKTVEAWVVVDHAGEIMSFHEIQARALEGVFHGASIVKLTGTHDVEE